MGSLGKRWRLTEKQLKNRNQNMAKNNSWKGGEIVDVCGYIRVREDGKYKLKHRKVMENMIGRELKRSEVVHHWNEVRSDNREENLCLFRTNSPHTRLHDFARRHNMDISLFKFEQPWLTQIA